MSDDATEILPFARRVLEYASTNDNSVKPAGLRVFSDQSAEVPFHVLTKLCTAVVGVPPGATDEQRYQFLEARSQRDAAEADRLAKKLSAEGRGLPVVVDEIERLRAQVASMSAVCDAACKLREHSYGEEPDGSYHDRLYKATDAYRASQPAQPTPVTAGTLTPAEWEALGLLRATLVNEPTTGWHHVANSSALVSAIDKIRAARGSRP